MTPAPAAAPTTPPRWVIASTLALSLVGLGIATYLTITHFTDTAALVCTANSVINCTKVTTSAQSMFLGLPVAGIGVIYFVAMTWLTLPGTWRLTSPAVRTGRVLFAAGGLAFVGYLVWTELAVLHAICEWCTAVHVITLALCALIAVGERRRHHSPA